MIAPIALPAPSIGTMITAVAPISVSSSTSLGSAAAFEARVSGVMSVKMRERPVRITSGTPWARRVPGGM